MISADMYKLLTHIPRAGATITFQELDSLKILNTSLLKKILEEAVEYSYIRRKKDSYINVLIAKFQLSELGQVAIEEYEHEEQSRKESAESLKISQESLKEAKIAKWISIISIIVTVITALFVFIPVQ